MVEQGTENPCVRGSIPRVGTKLKSTATLCFLIWCLLAKAVTKLQRGIEKERESDELKAKTNEREKVQWTFSKLKSDFFEIKL